MRVDTQIETAAPASSSATTHHNRNLRMLRGRHSGSWWPAARATLTVAFLALVLWLIVNQARHVDWPAVQQALRSYGARTLLWAALLAASSFALYSTYDLIGRRLTHHRLPRRLVMAVAFVSYAFNLNFGSLVGGVGMRFKLYARLGLKPGVVTRVLGLSLITNWLGYAALAGCLFVWRPLPLPPQWKLSGEGLRWVGALLLLCTAAYLWACFKSRRRSWQWRSQTLPLPSGRTGLLQLALSTLNWLLISGTVFVLLREQVELTTVLAVMLVAAVAAVIAHVPAGLGVIEAVFVALLSYRIGPSELLGALLAYRALYYLCPLALALPLWWLIGRHGSTRRDEGQAQIAPTSSNTTSTRTNRPSPPEGP